MKRIISVLLLCCTLVLMFAGCAQKQLDINEKFYPSRVRRMTGAKFIEMKTTAYEEAESCNVYYFDGKDFDFEVYDMVLRDSYGFTSSTSRTTYYNQLFAFKEEELKAVVEKHGFDLQVIHDFERETDAENACIKNGPQLIVRDMTGLDGWFSNGFLNSYVALEFYVEAKDVEKIQPCAQELYDIIKEYLVKEPQCDFDAQWYVNTHTVTQEGDVIESTLDAQTGNLYFGEPK